MTLFTRKPVVLIDSKKNNTSIFEHSFKMHDDATDTPIEHDVEGMKQAISTFVKQVLAVIPEDYVTSQSRSLMRAWHFNPSTIAEDFIEALNLNREGCREARLYMTLKYNVIVFNMHFIYDNKDLVKEYHPRGFWIAARQTSSMDNKSGVREIVYQHVLSVDVDGHSFHSGDEYQIAMQRFEAFHEHFAYNYGAMARALANDHQANLRRLGRPITEISAVRPELLPVNTVILTDKYGKALSKVSDIVRSIALPMAGNSEGRVMMNYTLTFETKVLVNAKTPFPTVSVSHSILGVEESKFGEELPYKDYETYWYFSGDDAGQTPDQPASQ